MARDFYETTVVAPDAAGTVKALQGVKAYVVPRGAADFATAALDVPLYQDWQGVAQGPDPKTDGTGTNPITTGKSGAVRFWAEAPFEYDIVFQDTVAPARVDDRVGWNATAVGKGTLPTDRLAGDGNLTLKMLAAEVKRQLMPIGAVIEWWRPSDVVPPPDGFEIADGHAVNQHDFVGVAGTINMPNLVNVFVLGASLAKADGAGASSPGAAVGIRATGGSHTRNLSHGHNVAGVDHLHLVTAPDHLHGPGSLYTGDHAHNWGAWTGTANNVGDVNKTSGSVLFQRTPDHAHYVGGSTSVAGNLGIGGMTGAADRLLQSWSGGADRSLNTATTTTNWTGGDPGTEFRPQFVGLLRIVKVRWA